MRDDIEPRMPVALLHVIALTLLAANTNAAALAPGIFGGRYAVVALANLTIICACLLPVVNRPIRKRITTGSATKRDRDLLTLGLWVSVIAAVVAVFYEIMVLTAG